MVVVWITGLPCSGKSTIAKLLYEEALKKGKDPIIIDGDLLRKTVSKDLGFSKQDRIENNLRAIKLAKKYNDEGKFVIVAMISPFREIRERAKKEIKDVVEVFLSSPLAVCIKRDVKGLYKRALKGEIKDFTGISHPYEEPLNPDIILYTAVEKPEESLHKLKNYLEHLGKL